MLEFHYIKKSTKAALFVLFLVMLASCASAPSNKASTLYEQAWYQDILQYESSLPNTHPDLSAQQFALPETVKNQVKEKFSGMIKTRAVQQLASWLIDKQGHGMVYDVDANLTPSNAFEQRRGNCLSVTILLITLAKELNIDMEYNKVDLPETWGLDEDGGMVFYRHVNAVFKTRRQTHVFDLIIELYNYGFPQRIVSQRAALALLNGNIGIEKLKQGDKQSAFHYLKLAVSLDPQNPDLWINLAMAYKRDAQREKAKELLHHALTLNDRFGIAASNLERLYRQDGKLRLAKQYEGQASKARLRNPYIHFQTAKNQLTEKRYIAARKSIKKAIRLHKTDPRFFELSGRIALALKKYKSAAQDMVEAYSLARKDDEKVKYRAKVERIADYVEELQKKERQRARTKNRVLRQIQG